MSEAGKRFTVTAARGASILLNGKPAAMSAVRPGDHVRAVGHLTGLTLSAGSIAVRRDPPKRQVLRGTVASMQGNVFVVIDSFGRSRRVVLGSRAAVSLRGRAASVSAIVPGAHVVVHGVTAGSALVASSVTVSLPSRSVRGQVVSVARGSFVVASSSGQRVTVVIGPTVTVVDGSKKSGAASIQRGSYVRVRGYMRAGGEVGALTVSIQHPKVSFSGRVLDNVARRLTVATSSGRRYQVHVTGSTAISTGRAALTLAPAAIPVGARVHVRGSVASDGTVIAGEISVTLISETVQGQVLSVSTSGLQVQTPGGTIELQVNQNTKLTQGTHPLTLDAIVAGDSLTASGYKMGSGVLLARKIDVHRKLMGITGTVDSITPDGFILTASDGQHRVIQNPSTVVTDSTGAGLSVGVKVHVTGYLRGDGAILATRIRIGK